MFVFFIFIWFFKGWLVCVCIKWVVGVVEFVYFVSADWGFMGSDFGREFSMVY